MSELDARVKEFLGLKKIAVVGVSDRRDTGCNSNYRKFKAAGYTVYAVNPRIDAFDGDPCYPDLKSLPAKPDGVFILANPRVAEQVVQECVDLGVGHVWMHCMMGTKPGLAAGISSVSPRAVEMCADNGIGLIPGSCPNQFLKPDVAHDIMRRLWRALGFFSVN
jgi:predicted CoA-binding protein